MPVRKRMSYQEFLSKKAIVAEPVGFAPVLPINKKLCPLQLGVIERAVKLWSAPGDTVFSPFAGIGSEGYVSLKHGRKFMGIELKESYWKEAARNLRSAEHFGNTLFNQ